MNDRGITAACEVDVGNAVAMHALSLASGEPATCLDWNNNYGDDEDKCILFHCGPVPPALMTGKGRIVGPRDPRQRGRRRAARFGCNVGRIKPTPFTFASMMTDDGRAEVLPRRGRVHRRPDPATTSSAARAWRRSPACRTCCCTSRQTATATTSA